MYSQMQHQLGHVTQMCSPPAPMHIWNFPQTRSILHIYVAECWPSKASPTEQVITTSTHDVFVAWYCLQPIMKQSIKINLKPIYK